MIVNSEDYGIMGVAMMMLMDDIDDDSAADGGGDDDDEYRVTSINSPPRTIPPLRHL